MKKAFFLFLLVVWPILLSAQQSVKGVVVDEKGVTLPGVFVTLKGTTVGTITDANGAFTITVSEGNILAFTFIGYKTQEIPYSAGVNLNITMELELVGMEEVVVTALGIKRRPSVILFKRSQERACKKFRLLMLLHLLPVRLQDF
jgi:hypothetical protein